MLRRRLDSGLTHNVFKGVIDMKDERLIQVWVACYEPRWAELPSTIFTRATKGGVAHFPICLHVSGKRWIEKLSA